MAGRPGRGRPRLSTCCRVCRLRNHRADLTEAEDKPEAERFSIVLGGPFHAILRGLGLVGNDGLPTVSATIALVVLAWLPPALLAVAQSIVDSDYAGWGFFTDWTVLTRYLVAIWAMTATERYADARIVMLIRHFREARLLSIESLPAFSAAVTRADRRSSSNFAEITIIIAALVWSSFSATYVIETAVSNWSGTLVAGEPALSWAGQFTRFVSTPLFLFLVLRWFWRFIVWALLLFSISRLVLHLSPLHPDRAAGLGFLAIYPSIFSGYIFSLGCVVAAAAVTELSLVQHSLTQMWFLVAGWIVMNLILFLGPLFVFSVPLYHARERALLEYGRLTNQHHLAFHHRWIRGRADGEELLGSPDPSSVSDLNASVQMVHDMRTIPVDRAAIIQLVAAAGIPMLAVVVTKLPLSDLLKWIFTTII